jgi:hypothetical protein
VCGCVCVCVRVCVGVCVVSVDQFSPKPNICGQGVGCNPLRVHIVTDAVIAIVAFVAFNCFLQFSQRFFKTLRQTEQKSFLGHAQIKNVPTLIILLTLCVCVCVGCVCGVCVCVCMSVGVVSVDQFSPKHYICGQGVGCNPIRVKNIAVAVIAIMAFAAFDHFLQHNQRSLQKFRQTEQKSHNPISWACAYKTFSPH